MKRGSFSILTYYLFVIYLPYDDIKWLLLRQFDVTEIINEILRRRTPPWKYSLTPQENSVDSIQRM